MNSKAKLYISSTTNNTDNWAEKRMDWFWQLLNSESSINAFSMKKLKKSVFSSDFADTEKK